MNDNVSRLTEKAKLLGNDVYAVCKGVLEDERFPVWSGSSQPIQHHYGKGGLAQHTLEVVDLCFRVKSLYEHKFEIDSKELFLSAFFHDIGKMWDYMPVFRDGNTKNDYKEWRSAIHKRYIHHISRSAIVWSDESKRYQAIYDEYFERVLHAILAHHTSRAAGSPVAPKSRVAWMLTLCDNLSARINDADTWDILEYRNKK